MTIGVWILPTVAFFCKTGITLEILAKKLSKNYQHFYLLPFASRRLHWQTSLPSALGY
jgi:hypothetical protein